MLETFPLTPQNLTSVELAQIKAAMNLVMLWTDFMDSLFQKPLGIINQHD